MNNISLFENLFVKLLKYCYEFVETNKRPKMFLIGGAMSINENEFCDEVDQLNKPTQRINRITKLTQKILELWMSDVKDIDPTDEIRCIRIDKDYKIWLRLPTLSVDEWEESTANVRAYLMEDLIKLTNNINGYCGQPDPIDENAKPTEKPQPDTIDERKEPKEIENPYPNIFIGDGYEIWEQYRKELDITDASRTDARFIFEVLKRDGLIFKTVGEKVFRDWMAETYGIVMDKMPYTNIKQPSNCKRMAFYQSIKENKA